MITKIQIGGAVDYISSISESQSENVFAKQAEKLVDLISIESQKKGVLRAFDLLADDIFELKIYLYKNNQLLSSIFNNFPNLIQERLHHQFEQSTEQARLEQYFVNAISIIKSINENFGEAIQEDDTENAGFANYGSYSGFMQLLNSIPGNEEFSEFIRSSLFIEYAIVLSELFLKNTILLDDIEIDNLCNELKYHTEEYALYLNKTGVWSPSDKDESQWIRNIKIRISYRDSTQALPDFSKSDIRIILADL